MRARKMKEQEVQLSGNIKEKLSQIDSLNSQRKYKDSLEELKIL